MADRRPNGAQAKGAELPNRINRLWRAQIEAQYGQLTNLVMLTNKGLNSEETTELRGEMRAKGLRYRVVRNRISIQAFRALGLADAEKLFSGPTAIIDAEDPVTAAKLAVEFCRKFEKKVKIIGGVLEGRVLGAAEIGELAKSKSRPELLAEVVALNLGPGGRLAAQLKGPGGRIAGAVKALVEKLEKEAGPAQTAEAPPAEAKPVEAQG